MNCTNHPDVPVSAYCRTCGKALCAQCRRDANGSVFCEEHAPADPLSGPRVSGPRAPVSPLPPPFPAAAPPFAGPASAPPPFTAPVSDVPPYAEPSSPPPLSGSPYVHGNPAGNFGTSPGLAFVLGFIPGVGAIYNGQYAKGLVHAVVFGLLISLLNGGHAGPMEPLFAILLTIFIFYMAFEAHHTARNRRDGHPVDELSSLVNVPVHAGGAPVGPVMLIGLGVLLLLDTLDVISFARAMRYWPVLLIAGGAYMLYARVEGRARPSAWEARDERR